MKKWECTVCGYIHEGDEPPENCPICGAGKEYFKEITEKGQEETPSLGAEESGSIEDTPAAALSGLTGLVLNFHLHPIAVHTPNGVLPMAILFLLINVLLGMAGFEQAAFYSFIFVLITMPLVIFTGYLEWQNRYKGVKTKIFMVKIGASIVVCSTLLAMIIWRFVNPEVAASASQWIYLLVGLVMVAAVGLAGHMGGKLVFDTRDR